MTRTGEWFHNVETGEVALGTLTPDDGEGDRLVSELWLHPGAAVVGAHVHPVIAERFEVLEGLVGFERDGVRSEGGPGTVVEIPPGVVHDWWNAGEGVAHVRVHVEPARRFVEAIEVVFSLANTGRTRRGGMPGPLWGAAVAHEYRDVLRFSAPPAPLQRLLFPPLAALARLLGRDPRDPSLHGPDCAARLQGGPDADLLAKLGPSAAKAVAEGGSSSTAAPA
jgi:quercetin dioxygenase-like cupin family protein